MDENKAKVSIQLDRKLAQVSPLIFGHFTEHAFSNIYGGVYDPAHPLADEDGMRSDVLEKLRGVKTPLLRYPGGNFVSNYHWEDGVGPREKRPRVFEYAWHTEESNHFGTAEFVLLCRKVGAEPYLCVNMGTGTVEEAMHWVEYCNGTGNTYYANLRRAHGYEEPFNVKYWGLGNEMYGDWQMSKLSAEEYGKRALEFAKAMKWVDDSIKLVVCGLQDSCDWNVEALKPLYSMADYISAHVYAVGWGAFKRGDYLENLYVPMYMEKQNNMAKASIVVAQNDDEDRIRVAWDEWNLFGWVVEGVNDDRSYDLHNAIITALILNFFIKNADSIGMANYSTFVNINGALSVTAEGAHCRAQYSVFELLSGNIGDQLVDSWVQCGGYDLKVPENASKRKAPGTDSLLLHKEKENRAHIPFIDAVVTVDGAGNIYLSVINKHMEQDMEVTLDFLGDEAPEGDAVIRTIYADELCACNPRGEEPQVRIQDMGSVPAGKTMTVKLKKHSINLIQLKKG